MLDEKKPISAPSDVAGNGDGAAVRSGPVVAIWQMERRAFCFAVAGHVLDGSGSVLIECRGDHSDGRLDAMFPRLDATKVCQGDEETDRAVPAHSETADVVEKNDAGDTRLVVRWTEQGPDQHVRTARLVDHGRSE